MNILIFLLQKEFLQIFRNKAMLPIIFVVPIVQLILMPLAATYEIKDIKMIIVDKDQSPVSRQLVNSFEGSPYFIVTKVGADPAITEREMELNQADMVMEIPQNFSSELSRLGEKGLALRINAIDGSKAGIVASYAEGIIRNFNRLLTVKWSGLGKKQVLPAIDITFSNWYNPDLNYRPFMVSGILGILVTMSCAFLASMNIVKEKEIGTIEQINVTPIKKHHFLIGKLLPIWCIGMFQLSLGLVVSKIVYDIEFIGNVGLVFAFSGIYMFCILGIGLLISTFNDTQQQAMFIAWFFMVIFILMGGIFTSLEAMPKWASYIAWSNPITYLIHLNRMVLMKGSTFADVSWMFGVISCYAVVTNVAAVLKYRKTS
ncbi:ABC transporter permease (plasmid) [Fulvitalea axinellae]|uniref:ABC transporter permease n=1 Tax=Fulvitalea axinellae TaxID=1182444 RepID=A0AAU9CQZ4_9BACT|nr:ABC transporter permease [Fulvitalea axinellae]